MYIDELNKIIDEINIFIQKIQKFSTKTIDISEVIVKWTLNDQYTFAIEHKYLK